MQEELSQKTIALSIRTATISARILQKAIRAILQQIKQAEQEQKAAFREQSRDPVGSPKTRQTLKELMRSDSALSNMEVMREDLKPFRKVADKYGIDFAVTKEKGTSPPRYLVFFKGKDVDTITVAFQEYARTKLGIDEKKSIRESLETISREAKRKPPQRARTKQKVKAQIPKLKPKVKVPEIMR